MRIAIVNEHVDAWRGGAETSTVEMARALKSQGVDVTLIESGGEETPAGIERIGCGAQRGTKAATTRAFLREAEQIAAQRGFDVVHAVTPIRNADVYQPRGGTYVETVKRSIAAGRSPASRAVKWLGRRLNARQRLLLATENALLTRPDPPLVAAVSEYVKSQVLGTFELPPECVRVVFNGVAIEPLGCDDAARKRSELRERFGCKIDAPLVLFVAHNFKLKGLAELIRAAAGGDGGWICWVAGRDDPARYRRLAASLGVVDRFTFLGADVPVAALYAAADLLAHPTSYDPCSRVVLESLCCGLPAVTTRYNGAAEVIRTAALGRVIDTPSDIGALRRAIATCLSTAPHRISTADVLELRAQLSMTRHAAELIELYQHVLHVKRRAAV